MDRNQSLFEQIFAGMEVVDRAGERVGKVAEVQIGHSPDLGAGPVTPGGVSGRGEDSLMENLVEGLAGEDPLPEQLRGRMLLEGYLRLESSRLLAADRFILADQIDRVDGDRVHLSVRYEDLPSR